MDTPEILTARRLRACAVTAEALDPTQNGRDYADLLKGAAEMLERASFLVNDAPRMDRVLAERMAEIENLRGLIVDIVGNVYPNLPKMLGQLTAGAWQYRAASVCCGTTPDIQNGWVDAQ